MRIRALQRSSRAWVLMLHKTHPKGFTLTKCFVGIRICYKFLTIINSGIYSLTIGIGCFFFFSSKNHLCNLRFFDSENSKETGTTNFFLIKKNQMTLEKKTCPKKKLNKYFFPWYPIGYYKKNKIKYDKWAYKKSASKYILLKQTCFFYTLLSTTSVLYGNLEWEHDDFRLGSQQLPSMWNYYYYYFIILVQWLF
jgi:hypothetical protein